MGRIDPFLAPIFDDQRAWREDLDPKIPALCRLAEECDLIFAPADAALQRTEAERAPEAITFAGVHFTELDDRKIAELWLETVGIEV